MPLFIYKCQECDYEVEKFQHNSSEDLEIKCEVCEDEMCVKQISCIRSRTWLNAKDMYNNKIRPDAERIVDKVSKGSDKDFFDICGD